MERNLGEASERVMSREEFNLKRHQMEAVGRLLLERLLERKPSYPKEDCRKRGREEVIGSERKMTSGDFEEARW